MNIAMVIPLILLLGGCGAAGHQRSGCTDLDLAAIEARYVTEVLIKCEGFQTPEACPAYPSLRDKYAVEREEYVQCQ